MFDVIVLQFLTGVVQPYMLSVFASAAVAKLTMIYPLPPLTDIMGCYRTVRVLSQRLGPLTVVLILGSILNSGVVAHAQSKAVVRVYEKLGETSVYIS